MKRISIMMLAGVLIFGGLTTQVKAGTKEELHDSLNEYRIEEARRRDEIQNSNNSSAWLGIYRENVPFSNDIAMYPMCTDCSWFTVSVCGMEDVLMDEGYHNSKCYAYYYSSRGADMCPTCYKVVFQYGYHNCWESHETCSKGEYDVCPMQES